jgi:hypothetical protein
MPWWMDLYFLLFIIILTSNTYFYIKHKAKKKILVYEIFSTLYLLFLTLSYWHPAWIDRLAVANITIFSIIICVDFYFSIWGEMENIGMTNLPKMSAKDIQNAKAVSLIIASPAYITSFIAVLTLIQTHYFIFNI